MNYKGIIFDFNGVLWWDKQLQEDSWNDFALKYRGRPFEKEEMAVHIHGRNMAYTLAYLAGHELNRSEVEILGEQKESIYREMCLDQGEYFRFSPGTAGLLDFLADRNVPRTIATASGKINLDFFIQHFDLKRWFDLDQIVFDNGKTKGKPAPDFYQRAAHNLQLPPSQCVVVEDSPSGLEAAHAAEVGHIIALGPVEHHQNLANFRGVNVVIEDLGQVAKEQLFLPDRKQRGIR